MAPLDESPPATTWASLARALLATLLILGLVNVGLSIAIRELTVNPGYETIRSKWNLASKYSEPVDWLLVGDSTCIQGLDPEAFELASGQTALNLCTTGDMLAVGDAWFVREYLDTVGPPNQGILVTHAYDVWPRDANSVEALAWVIPADDRWRRNRSPLPASGEERVLAAVGNWFPLYSQPESVERVLFETWALLNTERPELSELGFRQSGPARPDAVERDIAFHLGTVAKRDMTISEANSEALNELVELARSAEVPLVLSPSPLADQLWLDTDFQSRYEQATAPLQRVANENPSVVLLQTDPWLYPIDAMQNADHIAEPTAPAHAERIVEALRSAGLITE